MRPPELEPYFHQNLLTMDSLLQTIVWVNEYKYGFRIRSLKGVPLRDVWWIEGEVYDFAGELAYDNRNVI